MLNIGAVVIFAGTQNHDERTWGSASYQGELLSICGLCSVCPGIAACHEGKASFAQAISHSMGMTCTRPPAAC